MDLFKGIIKLAVEKYPKLTPKTIQYGTAGFRDKGLELPFVMYRMGLLSVLRSKAKKATIGVMITASHNPEEDNGVKLVDPKGEILELQWEDIATELANVTDDEVHSVIKKIIATHCINMENRADVYIARDTRPSSIELAEAVKDGIKMMNGSVKDFGLLTTPQLHYIVCCHNTEGQYGEPTERGYYKKLAAAFSQLRSEGNCAGKYVPNLIVDGANGVGALKLKMLYEHLGDCLNLKICNDGTRGKLNYECGADFVKMQQKCPNGIAMEVNSRYASLDGDGDRLVYFYIDNQQAFHMLDGDKIATLVAGYLKDLVKDIGINAKLCIVQTAYANGSSTNYITNVLETPVACVPTGVKHLHHRAQEADIGVYFEANGHGTVLFKEEIVDRIVESSKNERLSADQQHAAKKLLNVIDVVNQTVGDAISDLLLVETILHSRGWSIKEWDALYQDLPQRQLKVKVADRNLITTTDAERICENPPGLQDEINNLASKYANGRSFVRPSGTEDIVRVYAEAETQSDADELAYEVSLQVYDLAGGVGAKPISPK